MEAERVAGEKGTRQVSDERHGGMRSDSESPVLSPFRYGFILLIRDRSDDSRRLATTPGLITVMCDD